MSSNSVFWGLRLDPGKRYSTTVERSFHVSMAALDCTTVKNPNEVNVVMLQEGENDPPFILCNLQKEKYLQCPLDLNFMTGDRVTFYCKGNGTIHLSGYVHDDPEDELNELLGEEEEEEEAEDEENDDEEGEDENVKLKRTKKGLDANGLPAKKRKLLNEADEDDDEDEDDEDEEDDNDDEDDNSLGSEEESVDDVGEEMELESPKKNKQALQKNQKEVKAQNGVNLDGKLSKKQKKLLAAASENQTPVKKTIEGGVQIKDIRVGNGAVCKAGQKAQVYYVGRLKSNNKVFDSMKKGNGFTFSVGKGEVIKGWDVGVVGMRVGGKRTIICPPNMAYGQRGSAPAIPPNSTLTFEVELRAVN